MAWVRNVNAKRSVSFSTTFCPVSYIANVQTGPLAFIVTFRTAIIVLERDSQ